MMMITRLLWLSCFVVAIYGCKCDLGAVDENRIPCRKTCKAPECQCDGDFEKCLHHTETTGEPRICFKKLCPKDTYSLVLSKNETKDCEFHDNSCICCIPCTIGVNDEHESCHQEKCKPAPDVLTTIAPTELPSTTTEAELPPTPTKAVLLTSKPTTDPDQNISSTGTTITGTTITSASIPWWAWLIIAVAVVALVTVAIVIAIRFKRRIRAYFRSRFPACFRTTDSNDAKYEGELEPVNTVI